MSQSLEGKVAIVTGGVRGIGRAICERFAADGAKVAVVDLDPARCETAAAEIGSGAVGIAADLAKQDHIDTMVAAVVDRFGRIDVLVNCAGIFEMAALADVTRESYARSFAVNVEALLFTTKAVAAQMIAQGPGGRIINLSSQAGRRGESGVSVYCATKAAVISITQSTGLELVKQGINVNAIAPGQIDTPMWDQVDAGFGRMLGLAPGEMKRRAGAAVPMGRMGTPAEVAAMASFLAGPDAAYVAAQTFNVDGANWMS